jgi:primosomal replication protein N
VPGTSGNRVEISGILIERKALRFTPAGVPVQECLIGHGSEQIEAGSPRRVECEIPAIALGEPARWIQEAVPGMPLRLTGFLAARGKNGKQLRLHVITVEFEEGKSNGKVHEEKG